mmetsp:Transcript_87592/g.252601  ORF Transcript_87592/g.252601 Transcript_87592/m.252601 type:complete len:576 (-) Transcript_87592:130-1857(-)
MASTESLSPFPDPSLCTLPQIVFLTMMYCYVLFQAANLLSDGSELLLLVPKFAPIIGSIVLPILGAVPDGVMVLCSGLGPDAQNQVSVGVGALAGSTIMLLTLPWGIAIFAGRVTLKNGVPTYKRPSGADPQHWDKLDPKNSLSLFETGIGYGSMIGRVARIMLGTLLGYFIIQGSAFTVDTFEKPPSSHEIAVEAKHENGFALAGLIVCAVEFLYYLHVCWTDAGDSSGTVDDHIADANVQAMRDGKLTLRGAMAAFQQRNWASLCQKGDVEKVLIDKESMDEVRRMCKVLAPFFGYYDINGDNQIDFEEFRMILKDVNENLSRDAQYQMFKAADTDHSGSINFEEFVACLMAFALDPGHDLKDLAEKRRYTALPKTFVDEVGGPEDGEESDDDKVEEEDMPEDLADLDPAMQQMRIKKRAFSKMFIGLALVMAFSDPTVDLLSEMGNRLNISPFYISFVLAPMASNASELVAAYAYASKRTKKSITTSLSTLEGAAVMNNTFCLGIFLALVYTKNLAWEFSAETIAIIVIELAIGALVMFRSTQRLLDGVIVLSLYPLALLIVWTLENVVGLD